jgi:hypothetical protein
MAVVVDGGGGDRKKPLSADLNLVPYIDLLTCMVALSAGFPAVSLLDVASG